MRNVEGEAGPMGLGRGKGTGDRLMLSLCGG
jgi:hypothetical protein